MLPSFIPTVVFILKQNRKIQRSCSPAPKNHPEQNTGQGAHVRFRDGHRLGARGRTNAPQDHMTEAKLTREPRNENDTASRAISHRWADESTLQGTEGSKPTKNPG